MVDLLSYMSRWGHSVRRIFERVHETFEIAAARQLPLYRAADLLAEQRIAGLKSLPLLDAPRPRT